MRRVPARKLIQNSLFALTAAFAVGARFVPAHQQTGPVLTAAAAMVTAKPVATDSGSATATSDMLATETSGALTALASSVRRLSHPQALEDAFRSYFAFKAAHPDAVKKPYLYFVDYGLSNTTPRGY